MYSLNKEVKTRQSRLFSPSRRARGGYNSYQAYNYDCPQLGFVQRTESRDTGFLQMKKIAADERLPIQTRRFASSRDEGSPFFTERIHVSNSHMDDVSSKAGTGPYDGFYRGPLMAINTSTVLPSLQSTTARDLEMIELFGLGGTAINRTLPLSPDIDLSVSVGEIARDGLPSMVGHELLRRQRLSKKEYLKGSASEYLNFQFGIMPTARDIQSLIGTARSQAKTVLQMYRDANRTVRRKYNYPIAETRSETFMNSGLTPFAWGANYPGTFSTTGTLVRYRVEERETWFSGRYRYYLPEGDTLAAKAERLLHESDRLYGVKITPETLWNVSPWLWLSDWFVSVGDVVSNISRMGSDRIAMQYGYIMRRTKITDTYVLRGCRPASIYSGKSPLDIRTVVSYERKVRYPASPYGFGLTLSELSAQQQAILVALGITRSPGRF